MGFNDRIKNTVSTEQSLKSYGLRKEHGAYGKGFGVMGISEPAFIYLFICPEIGRFKIGLTVDVEQRLKQISKPYEKYGHEWIYVCSYATNSAEAPKIEAFFHEITSLFFEAAQAHFGKDEYYRSNEIYWFDQNHTSVNFIIKFFYGITSYVLRNKPETTLMLVFGDTKDLRPIEANTL
jgi:hypothetical protein